MPPVAPTSAANDRPRDVPPRTRPDRPSNTALNAPQDGQRPTRNDTHSQGSVHEQQSRRPHLWDAIHAARSTLGNDADQAVSQIRALHELATTRRQAAVELGTQAPPRGRVMDAIHDRILQFAHDGSSSTHSVLAYIAAASKKVNAAAKSLSDRLVEKRAARNDSSRAGLDPMIDSALQLAHEYGLHLIGGRVEKMIAGTSTPSDHSWGGAIDVSNGVTTKEMRSYADQLVAIARKRDGDSRYNYVIYDGQIATEESGWRWMPYNGVNPHYDHVHVSLDQRFA